MKDRDLYEDFYCKFSGTPKSGWSASYIASNDLINLVRISIEEMFEISYAPVTSSESYHSYLSSLHSQYAGGVYCEIGVYNGGSLSLAKSAKLAIGVDPAPNIKSDEYKSVPFHIAQTTSDDFFSTRAKKILNGNSIDLCFIDGLHIFEFALRDFIGAERFMNPNGIIIVHDILPRSDIEAARVRLTRAWTGDVWRLVYVLKHYRPDLDIKILSLQPTGLAIISNLNPSDTSLVENYTEVVCYGLGLKTSKMMKRRDEILGAEVSI